MHKNVQVQVDGKTNVVGSMMALAKGLSTFYPTGSMNVTLFEKWVMADKI